MKKGLVLEGGGIRGIFSAGVMDVLMEEGIVFDGAIGVSAGAAFGCNYKSKQPRRAVRYNLKYAKDPRYSSVRSLLKTGDLFNAQFCYHDIPEKLYPFDWKTFRENPMKFYLVCTDVETGKPVYHLCDNDSEWQMLEWFRASGSMPLVSRVVEIGDQKLLDGGITDSIPLRFMESKGYERNVVILTRPADYVKEPASLMRVMNRVLHQYPETLKAIENRHNVYNETVAYIRQREAGKYAFVIRPEAVNILRIDHGQNVRILGGILGGHMRRNGIGGVIDLNLDILVTEVTQGFPGSLGVILVGNPGEVCSVDLDVHVIPEVTLHGALYVVVSHLLNDVVQHILLGGTEVVTAACQCVRLRYQFVLLLFHGQPSFCGFR